MTWLSIRPIDVLLFRDGKPFSAGEDHSANSLFPPTPLTLQGALRAKISMDMGVSLREYKDENTGRALKAVEIIGPYGEEIKTGNFSMRGPFLGICESEDHSTDSGKVTPLMPVPADLLAQADTRLIVAAPDDQFNMLSDLDDESNILNALPIVDRNIIDVGNPELETQSAKWMRIGDLQDYKTSQLSYDRLINSDRLFQREGRFGVSTNSATSYREDGLLYSVDFIRMDSEARLLVEIDGISSQHMPIGSILLGGEQGRATAEPVELASPIPRPPETIKGKFKIVLLTPSYFSSGWRPDVEKIEGWSADTAPALISAALYKSQRIGGWSSAKGAARTMYAYAAPGSVYYFDAGSTTITLPSAFTERPDDIPDAHRIGFGQYIVAPW